MLPRLAHSIKLSLFRALGRGGNKPISIRPRHLSISLCLSLLDLPRCPCYLSPSLVAIQIDIHFFSSLLPLLYLFPLL